MTIPPLRLWSGQTVHKRFTPFVRRFCYRLALIDLDIDRLEEAGRMSPLFAVNKPALFSFSEKDHGGKDRRGSLRDWAEGTFSNAGLDLRSGSIRLVTFPRHFFYKFAPLSLWYGYDAHGVLAGIIYEVRNTFGERHCYVAPVDGPRDIHTADKSFHVSPFFDVSGQYRFTLREPDTMLNVVIENLQDDKRTHLATISARQRPATSGNFMRLAWRNPLSTLGVTAGIHWQALRLWLRGARCHSKPPAPVADLTLASSPRRDYERKKSDHAA